ncbi:hypothetical protein GMB51_14925 [Turicibacter sanguinis]|nr:hypothetical protein [Turicibacter sanguinis]MTN52204.1 hypothetical protein [Turicibacter sanguinis]MTN55258.1 hypothetical protein [Turicibacter sanguinis]MTN58480.1 hypothetical protein [Turicibacter sanguinis]MTN61577.1 hypothetical protein [Turicibacter sanguinis]
MSQIQLNISQSRGYEQYQLDKSREYRNSFVGVKTLLRRYYCASDRNSKNMRKVKERIQELESQKVQFQLDKNKVIDCNTLFALKQELSNQYAILREWEALESEVQIKLLEFESRMFDIVQLGAPYLSTHQKIQLLGGGIDKAREIIETLMEMEELSSIEDVRFIDLVMHHTEYKWNKQRVKWWVDCESWEMPVFQACMREMIRRTHDYEKQTGRCIVTELMEKHAKENEKQLVPLQTDLGVVMTFEDDIETKYERHGKVITLKNGSSVTVRKKD